MSATSSSSLEGLQHKFGNEIESMKRLQKRYQKLISANGQLETQLNENMMVKEELDVCKGDAKVYKLINPALILQTVTDAKSNVAQRIEYIEGELKRNSEQLESLRTEMSTQKELIASLEEQLKKQMMLKAQSQGKTK
jgi:prefoldin beta subunit